jgi:hypothetical protein
VCVNGVQKLLRVIKIDGWMWSRRQALFVLCQRVTWQQHNKLLEVPVSQLTAKRLAFEGRPSCPTVSCLFSGNTKTFLCVSNELLPVMVLIKGFIGGGLVM